MKSTMGIYCTIQYSFGMGKLFVRDGNYVALVFEDSEALFHGVLVFGQNAAVLFGLDLKSIASITVLFKNKLNTINYTYLFRQCV